MKKHITLTRLSLLLVSTLVLVAIVALPDPSTSCVINTCGGAPSNVWVMSNSRVCTDPEDICVDWCLHWPDGNLESTGYACCMKSDRFPSSSWEACDDLRLMD